MQKTILHVDINSYFATLLQQENPSLRGAPIGVIKDRGRTCLIATSKEAKEFGVTTGMRKKNALQLCPQIKCIPASFERYLDTTKRLQKLFYTFSPSVYMYSLDEAFIDISDCTTHLYPNAQVVGTYIQERIKNELGTWVTCNVGIASTRLLAKMASEVSVKGTITEVTPQLKEILLAQTPFTGVCGVGYRLAKKLALYNVHYPAQIRFIPDNDLRALVGSFWAAELQKIAYGEEPYLLELLDQPPLHMKSVGRSITGYRLYTNPTEIKHILKNLALEVVDKLRTMQLAGRHFSLALYGQEKRWKTHQTIKVSTNHAHDILTWIQTLYTRWPGNFPIIKFAIRVSLLETTDQSQLLPTWQKKESVQQALDAINKKYGLFTASPGITLPKEELIYPEVTGFLGDRTYQLREN